MGSNAELPCRHCSYDLTGLRRKGKCPECGQEYDMITGAGIAAGAAEAHRRGDRLMAKLRTAMLLLGVVMVMSCGGLLSALAYTWGGNWLRPLAIAAVVAGVLLMGAVLSYLSLREL